MIRHWAYREETSPECDDFPRRSSFLLGRDWGRLGSLLLGLYSQLGQVEAVDQVANLWGLQHQGG